MKPNYTHRCEDCGLLYTEDEVDDLEYYDGHRCSRPVEDEMLYGGVVFPIIGETND